MAMFLPPSLSLTSPPPFTAALSLTSLHLLRRSTAIYRRTMLCPSAFYQSPYRSPYQFGWYFEPILPPTRVEIFPEFEQMQVPLPPPMPADPPLRHVEDDEGEGEEEEYPEQEEQFPDEDSYGFGDWY